jgi:hypothetical protein
MSGRGQRRAMAANPAGHSACRSAASTRGRAVRLSCPVAVTVTELAPVRLAAASWVQPGKAARARTGPQAECGYA